LREVLDSSLPPQNHRSNKLRKRRYGDLERKIYISPPPILSMKKATNIKIEPELLKELKKYCIDHEIALTAQLENIDHEIALTAQLEKLIKKLLKKK